MTPTAAHGKHLKQIIDDSPMKPSQWLIVVFATILMMTEGYDVQAMAFTSSAVTDDIGLTSSQLGLVLSAGLVGMAIGTATVGPFADRFGRKPILIIALIINVLGLLLTATAGSMEELVLWRILTGIGIGGTLTTGVVLIAEYTNAKYRALALSVYSGGFPVGATLGGLIAVPVIDGYNWQGVFLLGAIISTLAIAAALFFIPESIDNLAIRHHNGDKKALGKAEAIARRLGFTQPVLLPAPAEEDAGAKNAYKLLFAPAHRVATIKLWVVYFLTMSAFYFVSSWTPRLMTEIGMTAEQGIYGGMVIMAGGVVGNVLYGLTAARWDARYVMTFFALVSAGLMVGFASSTQLVGVALALGLVLGAFMNGCMAGLYTLAPIIYPAELRSTGVGTALGVGRIGSILAPVVVGWLLDAGWTPLIMYVLFAVIILGSGTIATILPRRKGTSRAQAARS